MPTHSSRSVSVRIRQAIQQGTLSLRGPSLDSQHGNLVRHEKGRDAHANRKDEHGHQIVIFHDVNDILGAGHEYQSA